MMALARMLLRLAYLNLRTQMEYRFRFWMQLGAKAFGYASEFLMTWLVLARFHGVAGWSVPEVLVLWAILNLGYTLSAPFLYHSAGHLEEHVTAGTLDHYLVQPLPPLLNLVARNFSFTYSSQVALCVVVLVVSLRRTAFVADAASLACLSLTVLGSVGYYSFAFLVGAASAFRLLRAGKTIARNVRGLSELTQYPLLVYPAALRFLLTWVVPAALVNYVPALFLLKKDGASSTPVLLALSPLVPIGMGVLGVWIFRRGLDHYQGGGG